MQWQAYWIVYWWYWSTVCCISRWVSIDLHIIVYSPCFTNAFRGSVFTCRLCDVHGLHIRRHISHTTISFEIRDTGKHTSQILLTHDPRSKLCVNYMLPQHGTCLLFDRWYVATLERADTVPEDKFIPRCCVLASRLTMKVCVSDFCLVNHVACQRLIC